MSAGGHNPGEKIAAKSSESGKEIGGGPSTSEKSSLSLPLKVARLSTGRRRGRRADHRRGDSADASVKHDGWWYLIASSPWNRQYYTVANSYLNGDPLEGPHITTVDNGVPECTTKS